jgi:protein-tyrosine phosphatase
MREKKLIEKKILFVCLGNICRSPAAEGVMKYLIEKKGLQNRIYVDSAGTIAHHAGELPDARMRRHAEKRGIDLNSRARKFDKSKDFEEFDYIVTMDDENYRNIKMLDNDNKYGEKIKKMVTFCKQMKVSEVPDPYYGGAEGFELVLNILEDGCESLLERIEDELKR